jgi:hypothetical protein
MKTQHFLVISIIGILLLASCNSATSTSSSESKEMNSALKFHIETASHDLRYAIQNTTPETVRASQQFIEYAQITIPQAIALCNQIDEPEIAAKLTVIDQDISSVLKDSTQSGAILISKINKACDDLDNLLKL